MTKIEFSDVALNDIEHIQTYFIKFGSNTCRNILGDINFGFDQLVTFPEIGRELSKLNCRRIITPKYRFKIHYRLNKNIITVISVTRQQNRVF